MNFYLEDRNLQFLCETVMDAATFERARPHLINLGEVAGGELDQLAAGIPAVFRPGTTAMRLSSEGLSSEGCCTTSAITSRWASKLVKVFQCDDRAGSDDEQSRVRGIAQGN